MRNTEPTGILFRWAGVRRNYVWTQLGNYTHLYYITLHIVICHFKLFLTTLTYIMNNIVLLLIIPFFKKRNAYKNVLIDENVYVFVCQIPRPKANIYIYG